jgi:hypothetical protein
MEVTAVDATRRPTCCRRDARAGDAYAISALALDTIEQVLTATVIEQHAWPRRARCDELVPSLRNSARQADIVAAPELRQTPMHELTSILVVLDGSEQE